ncbi:hypothetical protein BDV36DRAFT_58413 [Aspergillus pseudocaelatus]|uniref:Uncharacterized protein n=1 Tax=Aspergillus pseudocaelatus TaxID=1825620 RepID=A0ABQ6W8J5_9EURO|nr:hypothetical protein BDV36DRAFT_58413 [Aspergillus pseudocaelatus]
MSFTEWMVHLSTKHKALITLPPMYILTQAECTTKSMYSKPHFPLKDSYPPNISILVLNMLTQCTYPQIHRVNVELICSPFPQHPVLEFTFSLQIIPTTKLCYTQLLPCFVPSSTRTPQIKSRQSQLNPSVPYFTIELSSSRNRLVCLYTGFETIALLLSPFHDGLALKALSLSLSLYAHTYIYSEFSDLIKRTPATTSPIPNVSGHTCYP